MERFDPDAVSAEVFAVLNDVIITDEPLRPGLVTFGGVTIVEFGPEFSEIHSGDLSVIEDVLAKAAATAEQPNLVIDLSHTTIFCSEFIGVLIRVWREFHEQRGGSFTICGLNPAAIEVLSITQLHWIWKLFETREDALSDMLVPAGV